MRDAGGGEGSFSYSPKSLSSLRDPASFSLQSSGRRTPPLSSRVPSLTDSGASGHAPSLPLPAFLQSFSRHPAPAPRGLGSGLVVPVPGPGGVSGPAGAGAPRRPCSPRPHGVPVRLLDVLPGRAAAAARGAGGGPGPVPGAAPAQPPLPGGDRPLPAGASLPGGRGLRRRGRPGLGLPRGLGGTGHRPGSPGLGQRRRWPRRPGSRTPRRRGSGRWGTVSRLQPPSHPRPGPCYLRGSDHGEDPG